MSEMQDLAETAWEEFRARYHSLLDPTNPGDDGSTDSGGNGILQVRSASHRVAVSIHYVTELLNGSGDLPDASVLLSFAEREGRSVEDFTFTVLSLMFLMDGLYLIHSGKQDMVAQMFSAFLNGKEPPITLASTPLKTRGPEETIASLATETASNLGEALRNESIKLVQLSKKGPLVKGSGTPSSSGRAKAPAKK